MELNFAFMSLQCRRGRSNSIREDHEADVGSTNLLALPLMAASASHAHLHFMRVLVNRDDMFSYYYCLFGDMDWTHFGDVIYCRKGWVDVNKMGNGVCSAARVNAAMRVVHRLVKILNDGWCDELGHVHKVTRLSLGPHFSFFVFEQILCEIVMANYWNLYGPLRTTSFYSISQYMYGPANQNRLAPNRFSCTRIARCLPAGAPQSI
jgi:hypothetical protein